MLLLFNQYYLVVNIAHVVHFNHHILYKHFYISEGRKHDARMLADSNLLQDLNQFAYSRAGLPLCIYGHPAYPLEVIFKLHSDMQLLTNKWLHIIQLCYNICRVVVW